MKVSDVISAADALRPNTIDTAQKVTWLNNLEHDLAETLMVDEPPIYTTSTTNAVLLMPDGHNGFYQLYLMAMIDLGNEETTLYADDFAAFNEEYLSERQWWVRNHKPRKPTKIINL